MTDSLSHRRIVQTIDDLLDRERGVMLDASGWDRDIWWNLPPRRTVAGTAEHEGYLAAAAIISLGRPFQLDAPALERSLQLARLPESLWRLPETVRLALTGGAFEDVVSIPTDWHGTLLPLVRRFGLIFDDDLQEAGAMRGISGCCAAFKVEHTELVRSLEHHAGSRIMVRKGPKTQGARRR